MHSAKYSKYKYRYLLRAFFKIFFILLYTLPTISRMLSISKLYLLIFRIRPDNIRPADILLGMGIRLLQIGYIHLLQIGQIRRRGGGDRGGGAEDSPIQLQPNHQDRQWRLGTCQSGTGKQTTERNDDSKLKLIKFFAQFNFCTVFYRRWNLPWTFRFFTLQRSEVNCDFLAKKPSLLYKTISYPRWLIRTHTSIFFPKLDTRNKFRNLVSICCQ